MQTCAVSSSKLSASLISSKLSASLISSKLSASLISSKLSASLISSKLSASLISSKLSASLISSHSSHSSFGVGLASLTFPVFAAHDALVVPEVRSRAWAVRLGVLVPALGAGLVVAQLAPSALGTQGHRELGAEGVPAPTGPFASDVLVPALGAGLVV